ncbi:MAG TPA: GNAT family N-acetyltransferase [Balneolaceae bacterium]|nr:GNAT family N-acetyltransferase [Balneolaceae bacterium]
MKKGNIPIRQTNESFIIKKIHSPHEKLFKQFHKKFPAKEFVNRIRQPKETAYLAIKKGEIVAYAWVTEKELFINEINHTYALNKDEIFLHSCFVCKENRGKGVHLALLYERLRDYREKDLFRRAYVGVLSFNRGSIKGVKKAGFKEMKKIRYLKWLNKEKWWGDDIIIKNTKSGRFKTIN